MDEPALVALQLVEQGLAAIEIDPQPHAIGYPEPHLVQVPDSAPPLVVVGAEQGPPGPPGQIGPAGGSAFTRQAGQALSALQLVYEAAERVYPLDALDGAHIDQVAGLTLTAAQEGEPVDVQLAGPVDDMSWHWTPGPLWLGAAGALTQQPPAAGYCLQVGAAVSPTRIILNIAPAIELG